MDNAGGEASRFPVASSMKEAHVRASFIRSQPNYQDRVGEINEVEPFQRSMFTYGCEATKNLEAFTFESGDKVYWFLCGSEFSSQQRFPTSNPDPWTWYSP